ncbi:hypothetical protein PENSPDRAFT_326469 [Peniophora sp. CONT]|nr:hypothetical protein PENSPDRAFT_326469 [Peniophora sp. CONT]
MLRRGQRPIYRLPTAMRYRLSVEDRWEVMHQLVFELQMRFPPTIPWTPDLITAAEFEKIERRLAILIRQKLRRMNQAVPDELDSFVEDPRRSRGVLIGGNLPPTRSCRNDTREMEEARAALLADRPSSGNFVRRVSLTGNVWVLSHSGALLSMHLSPAVRWTHWLNKRYNSPVEHACCRAPDPNGWLEKNIYGHQSHWVSVCR